MTEMQVQDRMVTNDGQNYSGLTSTTQATADPATGAETRRSSTRVWSGRSPGVGIVWLLAGVVLALLALDFVFHATGAASVGFGAFIFSAGTFLAAPFAGIFKTTYVVRGSLLVWADVLAMVVYALVAFGIGKVVSMVAGNSAKRAV